MHNSVLCVGFVGFSMSTETTINPCVVRSFHKNRTTHTIPRKSCEYEFVHSKNQYNDCVYCSEIIRTDTFTYRDYATDNVYCFLLKIIHKVLFWVNDIVRVYTLYGVFFTLHFYCVVRICTSTVFYI